MTSPVVRRLLTTTLFSTLGLSAALLGGNALAQTPSPERMDRQGQHSQRMQKRMEEGMQRLEKALQLTPEQNTSWLRFKAQMAQAKPAVPGTSRADAHKAMANMKTPERLAAMEQRHSAHSAAMQQRHQAIRAFYADLSPEQQSRFDEHSQRQRGHGMEKMGKGKPHGGDMDHHHGQKQPG